MHWASHRGAFHATSHMLILNSALRSKTFCRRYVRASRWSSEFRWKKTLALTSNASRFLDLPILSSDFKIHKICCSSCDFRVCFRKSAARSLRIITAPFLRNIFPLRPSHGQRPRARRDCERESRLEDKTATVHEDVLSSTYRVPDRGENLDHDLTSAERCLGVPQPLVPTTTFRPRTARRQIHMATLRRAPADRARW